GVSAGRRSAVSEGAEGRGSETAAHSREYQGIGVEAVSGGSGGSGNGTGAGAAAAGVAVPAGGRRRAQPRVVAGAAPHSGRRVVAESAGARSGRGVPGANAEPHAGMGAVAGAVWGLHAVAA